MKRFKRSSLFVVFAALFVVTPLFGEPLHKIRLQNVEALQFFVRWSPTRTPMLSAHRGGPMPGYPENAIETFENALRYTQCVIECDVAMTSDSVLVMMHDDRVDRTTTGAGRIDSLTYADVSALRLVDNEGHNTSFSVPTFEDVLLWAKENTLLTVDVKRSVGYAPVLAMIDSLDAEACSIVITYTFEQAKMVHEINPNLVLSVTIKNKEDLARYLDAGIPPQNMVAFVGVSEPTKEHYKLLHEHGIRTILGTMGNLDRKAKKRGAKVFRKLFENGADILSTDTVPKAAEGVEQYLHKHMKKAS